MRQKNYEMELDDTVDIDTIEGRYKNGVRHVTLPKNEKAQQLSRVISVE